MKIKLKVNAVIDGAVWNAGDVVEVPDGEANRMIELGEAESVSSSAPKTAPSSAIKKDDEK